MTKLTRLEIKEIIADSLKLINEKYSADEKSFFTKKNLKKELESATNGVSNFPIDVAVFRRILNKICHLVNGLNRLNCKNNKLDLEQLTYKLNATAEFEKNMNKLISMKTSDKISSVDLIQNEITQMANANRIYKKRKDIEDVYDIEFENINLMKLIKTNIEEYDKPFPPFEFSKRRNQLKKLKSSIEIIKGANKDED